MLSLSMHQRNVLKDQVRDVIERLMDEVINEIDVTDYVTEERFKEMIGDGIMLDLEDEIEEMISEVLDEG